MTPSSDSWAMTEYGGALGQHCRVSRLCVAAGAVGYTVDQCCMRVALLRRYIAMLHQKDRGAKQGRARY